MTKQTNLTLNGGWTVLLKVSLILVPICITVGIGWATWATRSIMETVTTQNKVTMPAVTRAEERYQEIQKQITQMAIGIAEIKREVKN